ncbi:2'-5' RNA ligase family protein [bacterium]|nr:2'-5' RNA ligase family protein [bacterium]
MIRLPYTIAFLMPGEACRIFPYYQRRLSGLCNGFETSETMHLTIKYLGYPSDPPDDRHMLSLLPSIAEIAKQFVPIWVAVRGIDLFEFACNRDPVIYLKVYPREPLFQFHQMIRKKLGSSIDQFPETDGEKYMPHISLSREGKISAIDRIRKVIYRMRRVEKREFRLTHLVLLTHSLIYPVLPT